MNHSLILIYVVVGSALTFDLVNGLHDASNSIATIVATKVLKPLHAVIWAAFFNFAALFFFGSGVARTVGSGMIDLQSVTTFVILSALLGAIAWGLLSWWLRMPTSSSHALLGGYAGAAMCYSVTQNGYLALFKPLLFAGWIKTLFFIVLAPLLGFCLAWLLMSLTLVLQKKFSKLKNVRTLKIIQLFSSAFLSLMHGSNDAQKTAGIIASVLVTSGAFKTFEVPMWVLWISYTTMGLGTLLGGWRIVKTMGYDLTRLQANGGVCAETAAALSILVSTCVELPVSTTQVTTGAILGVGARRNIRSVRWSLALKILWTWLSTIPASALMGALFMRLALLSGASSISF